MNDYIGKHVKRFESGNKGSLALASCGNDWGISCGSYQLTLRWGNCISFLKKYFPTKAKNLYFNSNKSDITTQSYPGSDYCSSPSDVKAIWTACYNEAGADKFFQYEHEHIKSMYYDPLLVKSPIKPYNRALQECFLSWAVHEGVRGALTGLNKLKDVRSDKLFDAIYDYRYEVYPFARYGPGPASEREVLRPYLKQTVFEEGVCMSDKIITAEQFIENAKTYLGHRYAYAATGELLTEAMIKNWAKIYPNMYSQSYLTRTLKHVGYKGVDCSGLCFLATGKKASRLSSAGLLELAQKSGKVMTASQAPIGSILYKSGHVGIKISQAQHLEARGVDYGVVIKDISSQPWTCALLMPYIDYGNNYTSPQKTVKKDSSKDDIKWLQELLNKLDNSGLVVDGIYGTKTLAAHQTFNEKIKYTIL